MVTSRNLERGGTRVVWQARLSQNLFLGLILLFAGPGNSAAANDDAQTLQLTAKAREQILSEAADAIEEHYLDGARGKEISQALRSRAARSGLRYTSPMTFAREATSYLFELSGDRHLSMKWNPAGGSAAAGSTSRFSDHGIKAVQFLPGNIGLLRIDRFYEDPAARESLTAALFLLRSSDALILDFRENRGGASGAVRLLQSCFFDEPVLTMYYEDTPGQRKPSMSEEPQDKINCQDKPFYMLTSSLTASAGEDFVYTANLKTLGTIVGETTAGAANFIEHMDLGSGFRLSVSVGRPVHPDTGTNWDGVGIQPDIPVPAEKALDRAHLEALLVLHENASGARKSRLLYQLNQARARVHPVQMSSGALRAFARRYGSIRIILMTDGLVLEDPARTRTNLTPLGTNVFQMDGRDAPQVIIHLGEDDAMFVELLHPDGARELYYQ